jgi:hypothetical protein
MNLASAEVRQVTRDLGNCRAPVYLGTFFTLDSKEAWYQISFLADRDGELTGYDAVPASNLYSCRLDGSEARRLVYTPSNNLDPCLLPDGRLLFSVWRQSVVEDGPQGRVVLMAANTDGTDYGVFVAGEGRRVKHMSCVTTAGLVVFVEGDRLPWDGAGNLACVSLRRNLHSYRPITADADGWFHSPSPLPDGNVLVSQRSNGKTKTHGVYVIDPATARIEPVYDEQGFHEIQARLAVPRRVPDGRSTPVVPDDPNGKLYCLDVFTTDLGENGWNTLGAPLRLRVLEGVPRKGGRRGLASATQPQGRFGKAGSSSQDHASLPRKRFLGEVPVEEDGSFYISIPADIPVQLQLIDEDGMALRTCDWIWARNRENRGCIGCHEDGELSPSNRFVKALGKAAMALTLPAERRRTVDFRRDLMPIIERKCAASCHTGPQASLRLDGATPLAGRSRAEPRVNQAYASLLAGSVLAGGKQSLGAHVHPGRARTSPLIWRLFGRNTSRPWDPAAHSSGTVRLMPPLGSPQLTPEEKRAFVEWIDLGAQWDGIPGADSAYRVTRTSTGGNR